jgi:hypothetical protein
MIDDLAGTRVLNLSARVPAEVGVSTFWNAEIAARRLSAFLSCRRPGSSSGVLGRRRALLGCVALGGVNDHLHTDLAKKE